MKYKIILFCFLLLVMCEGGSAETASQFSDEKVYNLEKCLLIALENNLGYKSSAIMIESSKLESATALAPFDPILTFNIFDSVTRRGGMSFQSQISGGSESKYFGSDFEISKQLFSGAKWSLKYQTSRSESQSFLSEGTLKSYESKTTLSYTHPILEGADAKVNQSAIRTAQLIAERDRLNRDDLQRKLKYQIQTSFYDTLKAMESVKVAELSLQEAQNLHEKTKAYFCAGLVSAYEVLSAESGLAMREEAVLMARTSLSNSKDLLKNLMGLNLAEDAEFVGELETPKINVLRINEALTIAIKNRPDLKSLEISKKMAEEQLSVSENRIKHMLAFVGSVGLQGEDKNWGGAISDMSNLSWYVGLNYSMPLGGNREAIAKYKQALLNLESINLSIEEKIREISLEVTQALRNIETAQQRIEVTLKGVNLQEEKLKQEKAKFELGLNTSRDLLDVEEDLASAKLHYIEARADYLKAISHLNYVLGEELVKN